MAKSFGTVLRKLRNDRGMSQIALAEASGISRVTLWKYETDKVRPKYIQRILRLFDALELDHETAKQDRNDLWFALFPHSEQRPTVRIEDTHSS